MHRLYFRLSAIKRPRLLMDAAKTLVLSRKRTATPLASDQEVLELISQEELCELNRQNQALEYQVDLHVALLASLIEQASFYEKKAS